MSSIRNSSRRVCARHQDLGWTPRLRELRFGAVPSPALPVSAPCRGRRGAVPFRLGLRFAERWPDVPYERPHRRPAMTTACDRAIASVLDEAAHTMARRARPRCAGQRPAPARAAARSENASGRVGLARSMSAAACLTNLHQPAERALVAIEAVTTESIHQLLYRTELRVATSATRTRADLPLAVVGRRCCIRWCTRHSSVRAAHLGSELALAAGVGDRAAHARGESLHCLFGFEFLDDLPRQPGVSLASVRRARARGHPRDGCRGASRDARGEPHATRCGRFAARRQGAGWPAAVAAGWLEIRRCGGGVRPSRWRASRR